MDRRVTGEMNYLARKGNRVVFLSPTVSLEGAGILPRVECLVQEPKAVPVVKTVNPSARKSYREQIRKGILMLPGFLAIPLYSLLIWIMDRRMYRQLEDLLLRSLPDFVPDYIHIHDLRLVEFAIRLKNFFPGAKLIYDSHELTPFQQSNRKISSYILRRERRAVRAMDTVITVNHSIAERMSELYGISKPRVLYNSQETLETSDPVPIEKLFCIAALPDSAVKVLFQGSLTPNRNLENLLKAFQMLPERFHLFVLGNGPEEGVVRKFISPQIHFHNAVLQTDLQGVTGQATFGIIPYQATDCENNTLCTPNKLFEFMNAKLPVCSAELPEIRKILVQCGNGRCYPMGTPEEIAGAVEDFSGLLTQGAITKEQLELAAETYSYEKQIKVLDEVYI